MNKQAFEIDNIKKETFMMKVNRIKYTSDIDDTFSIQLQNSQEWN